MDDAVRLGRALRRRGWRLAVAESCTAGLLGYHITEVPGSSVYFIGGVIVYADALKMRLLQVQETTLQCWGAVSPQVALEMAAGVCRLTGADVGVSITGIAGPGGWTSEKPVGLTYIALAVPGERWVWRHVWRGDRRANRESSAQAALAHLVKYLAAPEITPTN
ncbi:MAG: hypothetical protein DRI37_05155 [Chloroflexi bacterium]|nr:MAG: hypothetical protein DRI37_05155 [Chloroflexota bacterium]